MSNSLIQPLFDRYYGVGVQSRDMSSHWQEYSSQFKVQIDAEGRLITLEGAGFGVLSCLVKSQFPDASIVLVDLGQTLLFQASYCPKAHPASRHALAGTPGADDADFVYCPSDILDAINHRRFDVAVNIASMQEMDPSTVAAYFSFMRTHLESANLFYCCNRQSKTLPDGQVSAIYSYPWSPLDQVLHDGLCPWHQYFLTAGMPAQGPRILGVRVPGVSYYDGPHFHRLVQLHTESSL